MRVAVFGGSYNPPHEGHIRAANAALEQLKPDLFLLMPTSRSPDKDPQKSDPGVHERLELVKLAAEKIPGSSVSDTEIKRGGNSYTADTVDELKMMYPGAEIILLAGADVFLNIETWYMAEKLLGGVSIAVFERSPVKADQVRAHGEYLSGKYKTKLYYVNNEPFEADSTGLRDMLKERGGNEFLTDNVYSYIIKNRLYGAKPNFEWLREKAYAMLAPQRTAHVQGCEEEAIKLAERWGEDADKAAEAAILHDITKKLTPEEQVSLCEKYGVSYDDAELRYPKLLHPKTGAALARDLFGAGDEVCGAVLWHTTGRREMTVLEKILYLADYIEYNRSFEGLDKLRYLAYKDMDAAMRLGLEISLDALKESGTEPHRNSKEALKWFSR
ncbi:MAG: nicotinate (nicotinamide) nucleotide adenylyltransferase [Oscillospiraceae bacterium]|nr:nicotinate (nicotinamide) nucleotide adenylyltransferase [Oscillospiraceae bacterium]